MNPLELIKSRPRVFDVAKRASRLMGLKNSLYNRLASDPRLHRPISFIQVGSNDGMSCDPIREFVIKYRWTGIVIEPMPFAFKKLQRNYASYPTVVPKNCAISYGGGQKMKIYGVAESAFDRYPHYASMISSADLLHIQRLLPAISRSEIVETLVDCVTIEQVLDENNLVNVDLVHLDVEGNEANILLNFDFLRIMPKYILFEHAHIAFSDFKMIEQRLLEIGFEMERFSSDTLASRP